MIKQEFRGLYFWRAVIYEWYFRNVVAGEEREENTQHTGDGGASETVWATLKRGTRRAGEEYTILGLFGGSSCCSSLRTTDKLIMVFKRVVRS